MLNRKASAALLALLISILAFLFIIRPIKAEVPVYIRANGGIDPPTAPVYTVDNVTYTLTANITSDYYLGIVVEKDNIVINGTGYTVQGSGIDLTGINLTGRTNVTLNNMKIEAFYYGIYLFKSNYSTVSGMEIASCNLQGIYLYCSFSNRISGNNITANGYEDIYLDSSSHNTILENNITASDYEGLYLYSSSHNTISGNNITANRYDGVCLSHSSNNTILGNNIVDNYEGLYSGYSANDRIFHNNFNNTQQAYAESSTDVWDDGYPSGGNYWSDYNGSDLNHDGIGDTPYIVDTNNQDRYPLMNPWPCVIRAAGGGGSRMPMMD